VGEKPAENPAESPAEKLHRVTGRVIESHRDRVIVELDVTPDQVGKKPECAGCGLCSSAGAAPGKVEIRAYLGEGVTAAVDDRVEVEIRLATPGKAALLLYGLPLLAFLGASLGVWFATENENASAISGFSALAAAFMILFLVERGRGASARVARRL
jgi:positive regulator of sigma E activity